MASLDTRKFLITWIKAVIGSSLPGGVIRAESPGKPPAPEAGAYASIKFLNPSGRLGSAVDQQRVKTTGTGDDTVYTVISEGMRQSTASLNIYGEGALDLMNTLRDSLDRADIREMFENANVTHLEDSGISDLTALEETTYQERAQLDLTLAYVASSEADVGIIEHVEITGTLNGKDVSIST